MANVFDVAKYVLHSCGTMTTMKLQKIVYYCQAWALAWDDKPIFAEDFQAWANGPVCPELFQMHKGKFSINENDVVGATGEQFEPCFIETMNIVIKEYRDKSPQWLSDLTHSEKPWQDARKGFPPGAPCSNVIEKEAMQIYYGGLTA